MSEDEHPHLYQVGALYNPARTSWPEGAQLSIRGNQAELLLSFPSPTDAKVQAARRGKAQFGWVEGEGGALLAYRFALPTGQGIRWSDAPYHRAHEARLGRGEPGPDGAPMLVSVVLVDASTGIVRSVRLMSWPARAADLIRATLRRQAARPYSQAAEDGFLGSVFSRYPDTGKLVRERADVTWTGGEPAAEAGAGPLASSPGAASPAAAPGSPAGLIARHISGVVPGVGYHSPLPEDLAPWHCYLSDSGHSIAVALSKYKAASVDPAEFLVPAPVKTVLRAGWTMREGFVVCELPYDETIGLLVEDGDSEYLHDADDRREATSEPASGEHDPFGWVAPMIMTYQERLSRFESLLEEHLGVDVWENYARIIAEERARGVVIPDYAPSPIAAAMTCVSADLVPTESDNPAGMVLPQLLAAVDAWRRSGRPVYYVHPSALSDAGASWVASSTPQQVLDALRTLPERCVYMATSDADGVEPSGYFLHLEHDHRGWDEIRLLQDHPAAEPALERLLVQPIHIKGRTWDDALVATLRNQLGEAEKLLGSQPLAALGAQGDLRAVAHRLGHSLSHLVAAVLVLGAPDAVATDLATQMGLAQPPQAARVRFVHRASTAGTAGGGA